MTYICLKNSGKDLDTLRDKMNLNTLYALKPLCIQENFFNDPYIDRMNKYIDLNNYDR